MRSLKIENLRKGRIFYEADHQIAARWVALENPKRDEKGAWYCLCRRVLTGVEIIFSNYALGAFPPNLLSSIDKKIHRIII